MRMLFYDVIKLDYFTFLKYCCSRLCRSQSMTTPVSILQKVTSLFFKVSYCLRIFQSICTSPLKQSKPSSNISTTKLLTRKRILTRSLLFKYSQQQLWNCSKHQLSQAFDPQIYNNYILILYIISKYKKSLLHLFNSIAHKSKSFLLLFLLNSLGFSFNSLNRIYFIGIISWLNRVFTCDFQKLIDWSLVI